jgi:SSS family solute:Na+ symporter
MSKGTFDLQLVDYAIIVVYFLGVIAHGLWVSRGHEDSEDYFLAGRNLPWFLIGFSLFASNMSGSSFVGLMGASYDNGLVVFNYEWTAALVLIFFALFMLPTFLRAGLYTIPQFLTTRYDKRSRVAYSAFTVFAIMFIDTAGALYAGGLVISSVIPGFNLWGAVAVLAVVAGLYTILGGLEAVVVTDTVQAILLVIGAGAIFYFGIDAVGGWNAMMSKLSAEKTSLIKPMSDDFLPWPGLLGVILLGFYYWTLNQFVVQRTLGARNLDEGRKGALFAGLLKLPNLFVMILPGVFGILLFPGLDNPDMVFPTLAAELLPVGFRGLILTALIAAIMSSLDSALNAAATLVSIDFVKEAKPDIADDTLVTVGRSFTAFAMVVGAVYAPAIRSFENLFEYFQSVLAYVTPPIVAVFVVGLFWKRANRHGGFWAIVSGLVVGVPLFLTKEIFGLWTGAGLPEPHFTYMAVFMFVFGTTVLAVVSLATAPPDYDRIAEYTFTRDVFERDLRDLGLPWYADFRYQAVALTAVMVGMIVYFW